MNKIEPKKEYAAERGVRLRRGLPPDAAISNMHLFEAINELRQEITALKQSNVAVRPTAETAAATKSFNDAEDVRLEIAQMVRMIGKTKKEIAAIKHPDDVDNPFAKSTNELDAIVMATESATNAILDANEKIEHIVNELSGLLHDDTDVQTACEKIAGNVITILEASNFQDITGQRMTKIINTLRFIEDRIVAMINIWGVEAFVDLPVGVEDGRDGDDQLMNGPAAANEGITQDDIDALFD
ncbi:protein phosphatase CheZ [Kiloniella laminariae]|uniref:Protein phosphatase CheZ n=1 Tax=Kiloniella laminariae TaxID=454162 RepID=A0ABT4LNN6_9PROT|nr:protein phosphatase CheZ [Kiloniella laminariae]MCZ4282666.1 protein phosphatase CheZ [Kiloniella laminariae]